MMNYQRSNPELQLLIEAGLSEQPRPLLMALANQEEAVQNEHSHELVVK